MDDDGYHGQRTMSWRGPALQTPPVRWISSLKKHRILGKGTVALQPGPWVPTYLPNGMPSSASWRQPALPQFPQTMGVKREGGGYGVWGAERTNFARYIPHYTQFVQKLK